MTIVPETKYAKSGDIHIAYQVVGRGPRDVVMIPGFVSHVEYQWEEPRSAHMLQRLASFSRLICFDKRGTGLSDRVTSIPTLEERMEDVRAVMDAVGSRRAALFGVSEGGPMSVLFAATYPDRTGALILYGSYARRAWAPDNPWGRKEEDLKELIDLIKRDWGGPVGIEAYAPSGVQDEAFRRWYANYMRLSASPGAAIGVYRMNMEIDVRHVLPVVRVPTLVLHVTGDRALPIGNGRHLAEHIEGAKLVELPGEDHIPLFNGDAIVDEIEEFLTGVRPDHEADHDRVLATILFTDIVGSTDHAAALGDRRWREMLEQFYMVMRRELGRFRGREVDTAGDGVFAVFDGPARAIRCAGRIRDAVRAIGIELRMGLHAGECQMGGGAKIGGIAVHIGARVAAKAAPGDILVSNTVKDLVAGSGLGFESRGVHTLKGVPGDWPLYAVAGDLRLAQP